LGDLQTRNYMELRQQTDTALDPQPYTVRKGSLAPPCGFALIPDFDVSTEGDEKPAECEGLQKGKFETRSES